VALNGLIRDGHVEGLSPAARSGQGQDKGKKKNRP